MIRFIVILFFSLVSLAIQAQNNVSIQYVRLEGVLGKSAIILHLHRIMRADAFEPDAPPYTYYTGNYYYEKYGAPIRFDGQTDSTGTLVLSEMVGWNVTGTFRLDKSYQGVWMSGDSTRSLPVIFKETYPKGTTEFEGRARSSRFTMERAQKPFPEMTTTAFWLEPVRAEAAWQHFLRQEFIKEYIGNDSASHVSTMDAAFQIAEEQARDFFTDDMSSLEADIDSTMPLSMFMYDFDFQMEVLYNEPGLLSMGFTHYGFTGGAHGNYATTVVSYDPDRRKAIELPDVLRPGYEKTLQSALNQAARKRAGLSASENLSNGYFVEEIPVTDNFYLTNKGIVFSYPPYEIASYADGQVELFVSFASLKDWLQKPWKK